jgi:Family of unknown function (DUF6220)
MRAAESTPIVSPITKWARYALIAVAWLFVAGGVILVYLAGLGLFEKSDYWDDHADFGNALFILPLLLPILALIGRVGVPLIVQAFVVLIFFVIQMSLPDVDEGYVAALHPINGFFLIGASGSLGGRTLGLVRSTSRPQVESSLQ